MKKSKVFDRLLLFAVGLGIMVSLFTIIIFLHEFADNEWSDFTLAGVIYGIALYWVTFLDNGLKGISKYKLLQFQLCYFITTESLLVIIFIFKLFPLPTTGMMSVLLITVLSVVSRLLLEYAVNNWEFFRGRTAVPHDNTKNL